MSNLVGTVVRTYEQDTAIPEHYRPYVHDVISHPSGWIKSRVVGSDFYEPQATHDMLYNYQSLPPFMNVQSQAHHRLRQFEAAGLTALGGVFASQDMTVKESVRLHERGEMWLSRGALLGPYFLQGALIRGVQFFAPQEQK